ncbi:MAG: uroporphyrinogen decarboxylase family protein [Thermodesulfobacteriota bacterium]
MVSGRLLFSRFLKGEPMSRPAFVPLTRGLPARIDGTPFETLTSDPTLWANSLIKTTELFGFDGVVVGFHFSFMAEACGCQIVWDRDRPVVLPPHSGQVHEAPELQGRMKNALEVTSRVFQVCRTERACIAAMTGPVTLASQVFGYDEGPTRVGEVKQLALRVAEAFCQTRPDVLMFMEGRPLALAELTPAHRRIYQTLKNVLSYYNVSAGLYLQGYNPNQLKAFSALKMDLYVLGPSADGSLPTIPDMLGLGSDSLGFGLGLPLDDFATSKQLIEEGRELYRSTGGRKFFFTSHGPVTRDIDLETLHKLVGEIHRIGP